MAERTPLKRAGRGRVRLLSLLLGIVILVGAGYVGREIDARDSARTAEAQSIHLSWAFDPNDDPRLVAAASDVFVGKVEAQVGNAPLGTSATGVTLPQTQYAVKITKRVKGVAKGVVTVNQLGGTDPTSGQAITVENDTLLEPGTKVLLITEFDPDVGWYHLIAAGYSHHRVKNDKQERQLVERFAKAAGLPVPDEETATPTARRKQPTETATAAPESTATETATPPETIPPEPTATHAPRTEAPPTEPPAPEPTATEALTPEPSAPMEPTPALEEEVPPAAETPDGTEGGG